MDPARRADAADIVWSWRYDPSLAILSAAPPDGAGAFTLKAVNAHRALQAPEGRYVDLGARFGACRALVIGSPGDAAPLAAVIPLDAFVEDRLDAARRLWRAVMRDAGMAPSRFTDQRRARLKLTLRALDAHLEGLGYREIARRLFGERVPGGAARKTDSSRSIVIRLVAEGLALMRGGYLRLLLSERRARKPPAEGVPDIPE